FSEDIDEVATDGLTQMRFKSFAINHVDRTIEQRSDEFLQANIIIDRQACRRIQIDQDIQIAARSIFAPRDGTEQTSVKHALRPKVWLRSSQGVNCVSDVHPVSLT